MNTDTPNPIVLLAEDDPEVRSYVETALRCQGYSVEATTDGDSALEVVRRSPNLAAILLDIIMPRRDGLATLKEIRTINASVPVIMLSGAASPGNIVEAMKNGAHDFLAKPVNHSDLRKVLRSAVDSARPPAMDPAPPLMSGSSMVFGHTIQMKEIQASLPFVAGSDAPALILGETGSGKEVLARELHANSPRRKRAFLKVNCAAFPSELVESELFGYERGAFTGAFQKKPGLFEMADEGTIFLDEIGDMDIKLQAKLLQVLQDSEFQRVGGREMIRVNVRVIAATHRDLEKAIIEKTFRQDLYYRLNVIKLRLPPLRERREDILQIALALLQKHANGKPAPPVTPALRQALLGYDWPGNIRELENVMRKLLILGRPELILRDLQSRAPAPPATSPETPVLEPEAGESTAILEQVRKAKNQAETTAILAALESTHWNRRDAAKLLRIDYKALLYKMKKLGIDGRMATLRAPGAGQPGKVSEDEAESLAARSTAAGLLN